MKIKDGFTLYKKYEKILVHRKDDGVGLCFQKPCQLNTLYMDCLKKHPTCIVWYQIDEETVEKVHMYDYIADVYIIYKEPKVLYSTTHDVMRVDKTRNIAYLYTPETYVKRMFGCVRLCFREYVPAKKVDVFSGTLEECRKFAEWYNTSEDVSKKRLALEEVTDARSFKFWIA